MTDIELWVLYSLLGAIFVLIAGLGLMIATHIDKAQQRWRDGK